MEKKKKERKILSMLYDEKDFVEIIESERPDFLIKHKDRDDYFGVEITEFYFSESNARIKNIPNYIDDIFNLEQYRHKEDVKRLSLSDLILQNPDGSFKESVKGIFQELPSYEKFSDLIGGILDNKNLIFQENAEQLSHINLIIFDTENMLATISTEDFYSHFYTKSILKSLYRTKYREVFLVTMLEKDRDVYIPLKLLLLLSTFHMFEDVLKNYEWGKNNVPDIPNHDKQNPKQGIMAAFSHYLKSKTDNIYFVDDQTNPEVIFGDNGILLDEEGLTIHQYIDYPLPVTKQEVRDNELIAFFSSNSFLEKEQEILRGKTFYAKIAFDVKKIIDNE